MQPDCKYIQFACGRRKKKRTKKQPGLDGFLHQSCWQQDAAAPTTRSCSGSSLRKQGFFWLLPAFLEPQHAWRSWQGWAANTYWGLLCFSVSNWWHSRGEQRQKPSARDVSVKVFCFSARREGRHLVRNASQMDRLLGQGSMGGIQSAIHLVFFHFIRNPLHRGSLRLGFGAR